MALVIGLAFLVLLTALVVAFFMSIGTEVRASRNYESNITVNQLISSATNLVTGQIVEGTRSTKNTTEGAGSAVIPPGARLAWASQPGLIRTWDDTGKGWKIFKLYSDRAMVVPFDGDGTYSASLKQQTEIPADWPARTAIFTDLNQPVLVEDDNGAIERGGRKMRAAYPIVDPLAMVPTAATAGVDGFSITSPPAYDGPMDGSGSPQISASTDPTVAVAGRTNNPAPMPVQWVYVLRDGTLTTPTGSTAAGRTASWNGAAVAYTPTQENPIVGRVAFWTDDETSKLNVNTASEPTPWDTPRAVTFQDLKYGLNQPAQHEYQRFPGHPFMTALSPVLFPGATLTSAQKEAIYQAIPRVEPGGSTGGTVGVGAGLAAIKIDADRLFANSDEFLLTTNGRTSLVNDPRFASLQFDEQRLRRAQFFLTANSNAPEINLYGQPRIALWPVPKKATDRTPYDKLAVLCTTLGDPATTVPNPFYFQRGRFLQRDLGLDGHSQKPGPL